MAKIQATLIIVLSLLGIFTISGVFAACSNDISSPDFCLDTVKMGPFPSSAEPVDSVTSIEVILRAISRVLLYLIPILAALSGVVAGYFFVFSSGDSENTSRAKTIIKYNIMAIILALASYSIILLVAQFFSN